MIEEGDVLLDGRAVKPAQLARIGNRVQLRFGRADRVVEIRALGERRGPASEARLLYEEIAVAPRRQTLGLADRGLSRCRRQSPVSAMLSSAGSAAMRCVEFRRQRAVGAAHAADTVAPGIDMDVVEMRAVGVGRQHHAELAAGGLREFVEERGLLPAAIPILLDRDIVAVGEMNPATSMARPRACSLICLPPTMRRQE